MSDVSRPPDPCPPDHPPHPFSPSGGPEAPRRAAFDRFVSGRPRWLRQFVKFAIVGASGTVINLGVFSLIIFVYVKAAETRPLVVEQVASGIAFCVAVISNYYLNRRWTFRHSGPVIAHFGRFFLVSCLGLALNVFFYTALHSWAGLGEHLSELLAIACVMPLNFVGSKFWAFR
jgi:putative flippase GtrA